MIRLRFLKSTFQNNMNENITLMIRINWIWHSQLHITYNKGTLSREKFSYVAGKQQFFSLQTCADLRWLLFLLD